MLSLSPARGLVVFHCLVATSAALAQAMPGASTPADVSGVVAPHVLTYQSAFEGYRPFADEPPSSWHDANETVRMRGGWKAYAREGAERDPATAGTMSDPAHAHAHAHSPPPTASAKTPTKDRP